mmetsp:Transcript_21394/g.46473  ORF Transcript_21394/g.46473 Transcript_21394/m.46473 type:complete len:578 (-) Transcript_21394:101-1834(-)
MNNSDRSSASSPGHRRSMTDQEEKERRASIVAIMKDPSLTPQERRKSIHSLMDGRRRSSAAGMGGMGMAAAAAMAAAEFDCSSSDSDEDEMHEEANVGQRIGTDNNNKRGRGAIKRSSFSFKRGSSQNRSKEKSGKRRSSLRDSFTMGFSKMGVKSSASELESSRCVLVPAADPNAMSRKMEKSRPPCGHYERHCSIVSPCCGVVFGCRICHDDAPELPPPFLLTGKKPVVGANFGTDGMEGESIGADFGVFSPPGAAAASKQQAISHRSASLPSNFEGDETHHEIDRFLIKEVICRECFTRQSSKTNNCINCGIQFGTYHCSMCNLWMSADEEPYHCIKCGFCRVGGRENFTHCDDCGMCIDALLFEDHNCKSGKYMSNCPVCQEDLFSSRMASHEMPCGHAIHWHCFRDLTAHDTRCPVCKKTAESHDQMEQTWNAMAVGIALQPVPADMARVVDILCNDCEGKSVNRRWHFLGVQCQQCTSFNTTVERTVLVGQEAADFLGPVSDISAQQWASGEADQNALTALMGGGVAGLPSVRSEEMDTEALNQSVAAEVMGVMNRSNQPFPRLDEDDEMD